MRLFHFKLGPVPMEFPFGKAPLAIVLASVMSGIALAFFGGFQDVSGRRADLVFATFVKEQAEAYRPAIAEFEKQNNVQVQVQVVDQAALQGRLQAALQAGADAPDMVELMFGTLGVFTKGPLQDVGFVDLTDRINSAGLRQKLVTSRFSLWSNRDRIFALPHDVHPVMLVYRRDLVEQLGIDVNKLATWDEFCRVGREVVTKDLTGDGIADRYMIDLPPDGSDALRLLLLQRGVSLFNAKEEVAFDDSRTVDTILWYVHQTKGDQKISVSCGWGQTLARAMIDGRCLFYICPDWRTMQVQADIPSLSGKLAVMPLPAWEPGAIRTSTWGGCGMAITKSCRNPDLAWKLAMKLYYDADQLGARFAATNILPPLKEAWAKPELLQPRPFFSNQPLGQLYAALAPEVPAETYTPFTNQAVARLSEAFTNTSIYYSDHGDDGLHDFAARELHRCAELVREQVARNRFLHTGNAVARGPGA
jgi:arabinosaccharide transport system substrate-binding protein